VEKKPTRIREGKIEDKIRKKNKEKDNIVIFSHHGKLF
jgi:hypothetical protein